MQKISPLRRPARTGSRAGTGDRRSRKGASFYRSSGVTRGGRRVPAAAAGGLTARGGGSPGLAKRGPAASRTYPNAVLADCQQLWDTRDSQSVRAGAANALYSARRWRAAVPATGGGDSMTAVSDRPRTLDEAKEFLRE